MPWDYSILFHSKPAIPLPFFFFENGVANKMKCKHNLSEFKGLLWFGGIGEIATLSADFLLRLLVKSNDFLLLQVDM